MAYDYGAQLYKVVNFSIHGVDLPDRQRHRGCASNISRLPFRITNSSSRVIKLISRFIEHEKCKWSVLQDRRNKWYLIYWISRLSWFVLFVFCLIVSQAATWFWREYWWVNKLLLMTSHKCFVTELSRNKLDLFLWRLRTYAVTNEFVTYNFFHSLKGVL